MQSSLPREAMNRRQRIACRVCGRPIEILRMREHLRSEHRLDSATLEKQYLEARLEAKRARRSRA